MSTDLDALERLRTVHQQAVESGHRGRANISEASLAQAAFRNLPALLAAAHAVEAVRLLHAPEHLDFIEGYGTEVRCPVCLVHYPCPTIQALEAGHV